MIKHVSILLEYSRRLSTKFCWGQDTTILTYAAAYNNMVVFFLLDITGIYVLTFRKSGPMAQR